MDIRNFFGANPGKGASAKPRVDVDLTGPSGDDADDGRVDRIQNSPDDIEIDLDDGSTVPSGANVDDVQIVGVKEKGEDDKGMVKSSAKRHSPGSPGSPGPPGAQRAKTETVTPASKKGRSTPTPKKSGSKAANKVPAAMLSENAEQAMGLVREVMKEFTTQEAQAAYAESLVFQDAGMRGAPPDEPVNAGKGPVPVGHPDCLTGLTFVVSGVLDSMERPVFEDFVRRHGGRVTTSVSGKSDFLVVGDKVGRSKVDKAVEKGVDLITEEGVWRMVAATSGLVVGEENKNGGGADVGGRVDGRVEGGDKAGEGVGGKHGDGSKGGETAGFRAARSQELWVDKYKPKSSADLVGNNQMVSNLKSWLSTWDAVHLFHSSTGGEMKKRGKMLENKKAVLLSGSPGIGKTSAALIIARECGYEPIEVNASDTRSKSDNKVGKGVGGKLSNMIREMSTNNSISFQKSSSGRKHVLIMDEVDGMSGGDRGGVADLIQTIKNSKVPIICICNDKYSQKLKSLRNHTIELDFAKPTAAMIMKRLRMICQAEGLQMNDATMNAVIQNANGGDIRLILGTLQMIRRRTDHLSYDDAKGAANTKDVEISPFQAAQNVLSDAHYSFSDRLDFCFQDMDLVPLLVQENYLNHNPSMAINAVNRLKVVAKAADCFSEGDTISRCVRMNQNWNLLPAALAVGTVMPATYAKGMREVFGLYPGENNFPRFSAWLGQNSSHNKCKRLLGELHTDMISSGNFHADRTALRLDYCGVLKSAIIQPLAAKEKEGLDEAIALMNDYALKRDDLDALIDLTKFKTKAAWGEDIYKTKVPTAVKTAFTRTFNAQGVKVKNGAVLKDAKVSKKRKASGTGGSGGGGGTGGDDDDDNGLNLDDGVMAVDEEDEEDEDVDTEALASKLGKKGVSLELKTKETKGKKGAASKGGAKKPRATKKMKN